MESEIAFNAPWGTSLKSMTGFCLIILISIPIFGIFTVPKSFIVGFLSIIVIPLLILIGGMFFMIRGYVLSDDILLIQRLCWNSKLNLGDLISAEVNPQAMAKSIRTCGIGGLFSFCGSFRNKNLGSYRAFATNPKLSVVLKFTNRVIVVTPRDPEEFVRKIKELRHL